MAHNALRTNFFSLSAHAHSTLLSCIPLGDSTGRSPCGLRIGRNTQFIKVSCIKAVGLFSQQVLVSIPSLEKIVSLSVLWYSSRFSSFSLPFLIALCRSLYSVMTSLACYIYIDSFFKTHITLLPSPSSFSPLIKLSMYAAHGRGGTCGTSTIRSRFLAGAYLDSLVVGH